MEAVAVELTIEEETRSAYELEPQRRTGGKPMPSKNHGKLQARISQQLLNTYEDQFDVISELSLEAPNPSYVPDVCIFSAETSNWREDEVKVSEVPLTVIEIVSPFQTVSELVQMSKGYFAAGTRSYWLVQPVLRTIFVLLPNGTELVFHNDILTDPTNGISVDLKKVFR